MLPVNCGSHSDYQNFVLENLRKYYPNPDSIARSTWDIIDRFWNLDLSYTDEKLKNRYSVFGPILGIATVMSVSHVYFFISDNIHFSMFNVQCSLLDVPDIITRDSERLYKFLHMFDTIPPNPHRTLCYNNYYHINLINCQF